MKCNLIVKIYLQSYVQNFLSRIDLTEAGEHGFFVYQVCYNYQIALVSPASMMFRLGFSRFAR